MVFHFYLLNYFWPPKIIEVTQKQVTGVIRTFIESDIYDMRKQKENSNIPLFTVGPLSSWHDIPSGC
jgi:hypothetical protein